MQAGGFLLIGLFGAMTLTSAKITAIVLLFILMSGARPKPGL